MGHIKNEGGGLDFCGLNASVLTHFHMFKTFQAYKLCNMIKSGGKTFLPNPFYLNKQNCSLEHLGRPMLDHSRSVGMKFEHQNS